MRLRAVLLIFFSAILGLLGLSALMPSPIDPVAWEPPSSMPVMSEYNTDLSELQLLAVGGVGPETIIVGPDGWIYSGLQGGDIIRMRPNGEDLTIYANTGGRANGLAFDRNDNLIAVDSFRGLLSIDRLGSVTVLATEADGIPFKFNDGVDVADDGMIWFTDASSRFGDGEYPLTILEARPTGRLLSYDPQTKTTTTHLSALPFPNGLSLGPNDKYLVVSLMNVFSVLKYWIRGSRSGQHERLIENLPGYPDDVRYNGKDLIWIALASRRIWLIDLVQPFPFVKDLIAKFIFPLYPDTSSKLFAPRASLLSIDMSGRVIHYVQDESGAYTPSTGVLEHEGYLYIGSVAMDSIGKLPVPVRTSK